MKLNSKFAWGLAWAGLAVVLAVPSMDLLTGKAVNVSALTSDTSAVRPAIVTTTTTAKGITITPGGNPVDNLLAKGKKLPSYISDDSAGTRTATTPPAASNPATTPAATTPSPTQASAVAPTTTTPIETKTASLDPAPPLVAPVPYPRSLRPQETRAATTNAQPLIIDTPSVVKRPNSPSVQNLRPIATNDLDVPSDSVPDVGRPAEWDADSLAVYLSRKGLMDSGGGRSSASITYVNPPSNYDADGFYLNDGPNDIKKLTRRQRLLRLFGEQSGQEFNRF